MGSDNVRSVIWSRVEPLKPIWVDVGSGPGLRNIFQAFYYGRKTPLGENRFGLSALSSTGIDPLVEQIKAATRDQLDSNYFLNLRVAELPLAFLYRRADKDGLPELLPAEKVSRATGLHVARYIRKSELDKFFSGIEGRAIRYIPDAQSGTRRRFDPGDGFPWTEGKKRLDDTKERTRHYETCVETFPDTFGELVTAAPFLCSPKERAATCNDLNRNQIFAAAVCVDAECTQFQMADFSVVIKIERLNDGRYRITNSGERQLAHLLSDGKVNEQGLIFPNTPGVIEDKAHNIVQIDALTDALDYLKCTQDEH
jgi:hypothetical protein